MTASTPIEFRTWNTKVRRSTRAAAVLVALPSAPPTPFTDATAQLLPLDGGEPAAVELQPSQYLRTTMFLEGAVRKGAWGIWTDLPYFNLKDNNSHFEHPGREATPPVSLTLDAGLQTSKNPFALTLRADGVSPNTFVEGPGALDKITAEAKFAYGQVHRAQWAMYLAAAGRNGEAIAFARDDFAGTYEADRPRLPVNGLPH